MKKIHLVSALAGLVFASSSMAATVHFPVGSKENNFYCSISNSPLLGAKIKFDTDNVKVRGFCEGSADASSNGHALISDKTVNEVYFDVVKDSDFKGGSVEISTEDEGVTIACDTGTGGRTQLYQPGGDAC